ncbi:unnamed protein product, partial [Effrenium voratum]
GSYEDALAKAEEATAGFQQAGNQKMQSEAMSAKIDIYLKLQRRPEARAAAQEAVALFKAVNARAPVMPRAPANFCGHA